ncbi:Sucrose transport protein SUT5 [Phytophthora citrophthora]|uniref:Sucrose transport protein SUT5 n=1 Tax=Phytophthora citrophthora TaxID=4793 RepID=A0AAD9GKY8_9STRA|nr:Sucrose transport protein SUT5 [Phytophthora citrophthora]
MKDVEAGTPGYELHASPKPGSTAGDEQPVGHPSIWLLLAVSMPRMAINMAWSAQWAALGPYLSTMLSNSAVQATQFIGPIVGVIVGPSIGVFSDRTTSRFGRRRPYLVVAGILSIICWIAMGYTREIGDALGDHGDGGDDEMDRTWTSVFTIFFYAWMDITVNIVQTPAMLIVADFAGDRQTTGAALGQAWSTLGSIVVAVYIKAFGAAYLTMHWFMGTLAVVMFVCVAVCTIFAHETPLDPSKVEQVSAWTQVKGAFYSVWLGIKTLPKVLVVYAIGFFFVQYGYTAYNGNKGQFFGLEVYGGTSDNADSCSPNCSVEQDAYNDGVSLAGGDADLAYNVVGYVYSWCLPFLVSKFGLKWVLTGSTVPQMLLLVMAWTSNKGFDVFVVAVCGMTSSVWFSCIVPVIIHVMGDDVEIGMYVGALNSANCFGQLLNFAIGTAIVDTSLGYKLPVFLGGIMTALGFLSAAIFMKIKMYSM